MSGVRFPCRRLGLPGNEEEFPFIAITLDPAHLRISDGDPKTVFHRLSLASWLRVGWWALGALPFFVRT
jgi:hypothetical protein